MKRIACLLALVLLLTGLSGCAPEDYDDLYVRILGITTGPEADAGFDALPEAARALYVAAIFDMEMQCGGLCIFFCNEGPAMAVRVSDSLCLLGLGPIADAYEDFAAENGLELETLPQFDFDFSPGGDDYAEEYATLCETYPFDGFDDKYMEMRETLDFEGTMLDFAHAHPEAFKA